MDANALQALSQTVLVWIGFGVAAGMTAKALLPGRDPGGAIVTFLLGILGTLIGAAVFAWILGEPIRNPISLVGFATAVAGSLVLLIAHRLLSGRLLRGERDYVDQVIIAQPPVRRRRRTRAVI